MKMKLPGPAKKCLNIINAERVKFGVAPLELHPTLQVIAEANVENLKIFGGSAGHEYFNGTAWVPIYDGLVLPMLNLRDDDGNPVYEWINWRGNCTARGYRTGSDAGVEFMRSRPHRLALISAAATKVGVAKAGGHGGPHWSICLAC